MGSNRLTIVVCALMLSLAVRPIAADEGAPIKAVERKVDVVVEGTVYCQSCQHYGSWSLTGAEPIPSAKVSVICKNDEKQVSYYKTYKTDEHGYFYAPLDGFKMSNGILDHPLHACHAKLVSSPLANCSLLSNVNYGIDGAPLRFENKILERINHKIVVYAAGPLAFRPARCPSETETRV